MLSAPDPDAAGLSRVVPLPLPRQGEATRVMLGAAEVVLEQHRGGFTLLWSDGRDAKRFVLGLTDDGQLQLELHPPRFPMRLTPREAMTIVPGGRLCGYVTAPLVPTLVWSDGALPARSLLELLPSMLHAEWDDAEGCRFACGVTWLTRFPLMNEEPRCVVPLRLHNCGDEPASPACFEVSLTPDDLVELRGTLVVRPRRIRWRGDELVTRKNGASA
jgi:hypothetical protein